MVEASLYASERLVVESSGNPHPCVQALLSEAGLVEEPGGVQNQPFQHATSCIIMGAGNGLRLSTSPRQGCVNH